MNNSIYENYVRQVVREGSLTRAAEKIGVSQPALSSGLTTLEKKLGFRIFNRNLTPVTLTPEGSIYFDYIKRKTALTADFEARIEACKDERDQFVSIGAPTVYSESIVAQAVCRLLAAHPDYSISIRTASLRRLIGSAMDNELDCIVSTSGDIPDEFVKKQIKQEQIYLCIPADRPVNEMLLKYREEQIPFEDFSLLHEENFILLEKDQPIRLLVDTWLTEQGSELKSSAAVNQVSTAVSLTAMGLGCCFASEDALFHPSLKERLCIYTLPQPVFSRPIYAVYHKEYYQSQACKDLIDELIKGS